MTTAELDPAYSHYRRNERPRHRRLISPNAIGEDELPSRPAIAVQMWASTVQRLGDVVHVVRHRPGRAVSALVGFSIHWLLRVSLPIIGAIAMLLLFPYHAVAGGIHFSVKGSIFSRPGFSADTTIGDWVFPHFDGLPIGAHISPERVDVVRLVQAATQHGQYYVDGLQADIQRQIQIIIEWLLGEMLIGFLLGLAVALAIGLSVRYLRSQSHRRHELRIRLVQFASAMGVLVLVAGYGALSFNPRWFDTSHVTGTLASLELFPGKLQDYYNQNNKATDVLRAIAGIEASLPQNIDTTQSPQTAYHMMFVSDMHLAATYPLVAQYAANFDVKLIINTGDELEFGTTAEMTPTYLAQLKALTSKIPMIWLAGNHDSPATIKIMRAIPGVIVLGTRIANSDDGFTVSAQQIDAFGLTIAALPDPRVYGGPGVYGSDKSSVVSTLEKQAADDAVKAVPNTTKFDIFATHEPVAANQLVADLPGQIRQTNAGHLHAQNKESDIQQKGQPITLVEASTGAGGLDTINTDKPRVPIEFSIESVAANCQFTKIVRFQIDGSGIAGASAENASSQNVSAITVTLQSQKIKADRDCSITQGVGSAGTVNS